MTRTYLEKCLTHFVKLKRFLAELEGKDVEDLFTAVLSPSTQVPHQTQGTHSLHGPQGPELPPSQLNSGMSPEH